VYNTVPFLRMPTMMTVEIVYSSQFWLNTFPPSDGVSKTVSPRGLVSGLKIDYSKHCRIKFGAYAQTHEEHSSDMTTRTTGAIALRPTGNAQGGYYFMSLTTGRRLNRTELTPLPMPQDVVNRVHVLARRSNANKELLFTWRDGRPITDDADAENDDDPADEDYNPDDDDAYDDNDDDEYAYPFEADDGDEDGFYNPLVAGVDDTNNNNDENNDENNNEPENEPENENENEIINEIDEAPENENGIDEAP
jgi:hypothetical protein